MTLSLHKLRADAEAAGKRLVLVVRQEFAWAGAHLKPGAIVDDFEQVLTISAHHPEKVVKVAHDAPAPTAAPEDAATDHA